MSEIKVNKISPRTACGTTTLGDSGDTINIPAGVTISNNGTATGFGATGAVNWDVASIKTVDFTAVSGVGYFVDTATTGAVIVTLPAAPAVGDVVGVSDYANNFETANCTLNRNGLKIGGETINGKLKVNGVAVTLVYVDVTKGWIVTDSGNQSDASTAEFLAATGGCITTCGNYKIHTFLNPGTFTVTADGNSGGSNTVSYLVVAGGGGTACGGCGGRGGGGGGGFRESKASTDCYTASPLNATSGPGFNLPVTGAGGPYPVAVGGGGTAGNPAPSVTAGIDSSFSTITSAGGGAGFTGAANAIASGGSGGGGGSLPFPSPNNTGGSGNTPPTSPAQGTDGGNGRTLGSGPSASYAGGGGGGAGCAGNNGLPGGGGVGGTGAGTLIHPNSPTPVGTPGPTPSLRYFAGGGGGGSGYEPGTGSPGPGGAGGSGGGGAGGAGGSAGGIAGGTNTGGGAGGGKYPSNACTGNTGGSGIVIIRYKYQ